MNYVQSSSSNNKLPSIFTYPSRTKRFTQLKSPMAHKTFSQQQFKFKFFFMSASFRVLDDSYENYYLTSINSTIYFLLDFKAFDNLAGSNLFILKRLTLSVQSSDSSYFNFYNLLN